MLKLGRCFGVLPSYGISFLDRKLLDDTNDCAALYIGESGTAPIS